MQRRVFQVSILNKLGSSLQSLRSDLVNFTKEMWQLLSVGHHGS